MSNPDIAIGLIAGLAMIVAGVALQLGARQP
jgi:hypothetical protein